MVLSGLFTEVAETLLDVAGAHEFSNIDKKNSW